MKEPKTEEQKKANRLSWAISNGFHCAPRLKLLVDELRAVIAVEKTDDAFKAELLLGYLAGLSPLPKKQGDAASSDDDDDLIDQNKGEDA